MPSKRRTLLLILGMAGIGCLIIASLGIWDYLRTTGEGASMPTTETLARSTDTPSEKDPGLVTDEYSVPEGLPRVIEIPGLGIKAYVQRVGVDTGNTIVTPDNIYFTGWYTGSAVPGETGVSIINGHAGGRYEQGVFRYVVDLKEGDALHVQMGDRSWREFRVESAKSYATSDAAAALFNDDPLIERELHLITCDGGFDDHTQTYDKRFIVVASFRG